MMADMFHDQALWTALGLSVVAGICSALGGACACLLEGRDMLLQRLALWQGAMGAALLFLGVCDILPEAAAGVSATRASAFFVLGAGISVLGAKSLRVFLSREEQSRRRGDRSWLRLRPHDSGHPRTLLQPRTNSGDVDSEAVLGSSAVDVDRGLDGAATPRPGLVQRASETEDATTFPINDEVATGPHDAERREVLAVGLATFFSLSAHNLLEGMSIFHAVNDGVEQGVRLATAVSLENFPEGMAISLPILYATQTRSTAIRLALCSGMVEPLGVLMLGIVFRPLMSQALVSSLLAMIAGILVSLSLVEILPLAVKTANAHNPAEFNKWIGLGVITATLLQPLLMFYGRVGVMQ